MAVLQPSMPSFESTDAVNLYSQAKNLINQLLKPEYRWVRNNEGINYAINELIVAVGYNNPQTTNRKLHSLIKLLVDFNAIYGGLENIVYPFLPKQVDTKSLCAEMVMRMDYGGKIDNLISELIDSSDRSQRLSRFIKETQSELIFLTNELTQSLSYEDEKEEGRIRKYMLDQWGVNARSHSLRLVTQIAAINKTEKARHTVRVGAWSGPQGTGKGTNLDAITLASKAWQAVNSESPTDILVNQFTANYTGDSDTVVTGTKGMFNKPDGEYLELFAQMADLTGSIVRSGELVGDDFVAVFTLLMTAYRFSQGASAIIYDLWPRTVMQTVHFEEMVAQLVSTLSEDSEGANPVATEQLDLRLVDPSSIATVNADRELFAQLSQRIAGVIKSAREQVWYKDRLAEVKSGTIEEIYNAQSSLITAVMDVLTAEFAGDQNAQILLAELRNSLGRMLQRFSKAIKAGQQPREDEFPDSQLNRLRSYYAETSPARLRNNIPMVSTLDSPEIVVVNIIKALIQQLTSEPVDWDDSGKQSFLKVAGLIAMELVSGKSADEIELGKYMVELEPTLESETVTNLRQLISNLPRRKSGLFAVGLIDDIQTLIDLRQILMNLDSRVVDEVDNYIRTVQDVEYFGIHSRNDLRPNFALRRCIENLLVEGYIIMVKANVQRIVGTKMYDLVAKSTVANIKTILTKAAELLPGRTVSGGEEWVEQFLRYIGPTIGLNGQRPQTYLEVVSLIEKFEEIRDADYE